MTKPRAYTQDEVIEKMMVRFRGIAEYWASVELQPEEDSTLYRCAGTVFTMLSTLDGAALGLPAMDLVLRPHEDDKEYLRSRGENWFKPGMRISTALHEYFHEKVEVDD